jgi:predicted GTPase
MDFMDKIEQDLKKALSEAAVQLQEARPNLLPGDPAAQLKKLATQVSQPCIVAVVGQVKVGKSSFINAFLGDDLAKVGTTETTATINYFRYSEGDLAPDRTVCCFFHDGQSSYVDRAFLDSLQGNDIETLRRSQEIDHLEYYLRNHDLERIVLVDTPGTNAAVDEHQNAVAEFMRLDKQLRDRHDKETKELADTADAVIYLIGAVAGSTDQKFLEEFHELTKGRSEAFNAVGVMSKIDLHAETIERRAELAAKIADQLQENLNTVVPVSAGIYRALDSLLANNRTGLKRLVEALGSIAPGKFDKFFFSHIHYLRIDTDWPVPVELRKGLRSNLEWSVFATIARVIVEINFDLDAVEKQLQAIAGFDQLREVLELHIFQRSRLLRYYSKVNLARQILNKLYYLLPFDTHDNEGREKLERYLEFIQQACDAGRDATSAQELREMVMKSLALQVEPLDSIVERLVREFDIIFHKLEQYNEDFGALQVVMKHSSLFQSVEIDELKMILGWYGLEVENRLSLDYVRERQRAWRRTSLFDSDSIRRDVANQVVERYGRIQKKIGEN